MANRSPAGSRHSAGIDFPHDRAPLFVRLIVIAHAVGLLAVVLGLTARTLSLDDIKKTIFLVVGPLLMLLGIMAFAGRQAPAPPRPVIWGFGGFAAVLSLSSIVSSFHWIALDELLMFYSAGGFMLSAMVIASHRRTAELFFRFLVIMLLVTNLVGIFLYDFVETDPQTGSIARWLANRLPPASPGAERSWWRLLLLTFSLNEGAMQSTILSRDFYAGFCICYLPFAMLTMLDPGPGARPRLWRALGGLTTLLTLVCVLKAQSKGEYIVGAAMIGMFFALIFRIEDLPILRSRMVVALLAGIAAVMASILWMMQPVLMHRLKSIDTSMSSREIIWRGAWEVFKERPVIGGGPGTFRIYFPRERTPDYFEHEIANVTLYAHNYFLDLLAETGMAGFGLFCAGLLAVCGLGLWWMFRHPRGRLRVMLLTALCALFAIVGSNLSSPNGRWPVGASSLYTVLGLAIGLIAQARAPWSPRPPFPRRETNRRRAFLAILLAASIIPFAGMSAGLRFFQSRVHYLEGLRASNAAQDLVERARAGTEETDRLFAAAIRGYESAIRRQPASPQALYRLGFVYTRLAELEAEKLGSLIRAANGGREAVERLAARMNENLRRAIAHYEQLATLWPDYAELHYNLGLLYGKAAQSIRMAEDLGIDSPFAGRDAADWDRLALEQCEIQAAMSNRDAVKMLLARQYSQLERFADAIAVLREAARMDPANKPLLLEYQNVAMRAGDAAAQCDALEKLVALEPLNDRTLDLLLNLAAQGRHDRILESVIDRLEARNPVDRRIAMFRFKLAVRRGDIQAARNQLARYRQSGGADGQFLNEAGRLLSTSATLSAPPTSQNR